MHYVILNKDGTFQNKAGKPVTNFEEAHISSNTPVRDDQFYIEVHTVDILEICPTAISFVLLLSSGQYYSANGPVNRMMNADLFTELPGIGGIRIPVRQVPTPHLIGSLRYHDDIP